MKFEDHFSGQAEEYARHRPRYPVKLFEYLSSLTPAHNAVWDSGTGNGQAAIGLVQYYRHVFGSDASSQQIAYAQRHERIGYFIAAAEKAPLRTGSMDLVTAAVAVHWFTLEPFYREVRRVLKPGGILAVWSYQLPTIDPQIDRAVSRYYSEVLKGYWPQRFHYVDERYETLPFPFDEFSPPDLSWQAEWSLGQLAGFLDSWSAARRYLEEQGRHPLGEIWEELTDAWDDPVQKRTLNYPLFIRVGKVG